MVNSRAPEIAIYLRTHLRASFHHMSVNWLRMRSEMAVLDWTTGLDYWTHGNCLWGRLNEQQTMRRAKTPSHKTCSSVVVAHLVPSHPAFFVSGREPGREPGRG